MANRWKINHHELPYNTELSEIAMLGSHDAGTYAFTRTGHGMSLGSLLPFAFVTQHLTLREQAQTGCTYFDVRVAENKDGSFSFFHGPSVANGDAVRDVKELLEYAKDDARNFYLLKIAFKQRDAASSGRFLRDVLSCCAANLIKPGDVFSLAKAPVSMLQKRKNIGIMLHNFGGTDAHWVYKEQVHTEWANMASGHRTARFLRDFHSYPAPANKLNIVQTNVPFASLKHMKFNPGVSFHLNSHGHYLVSAVKRINFAGIISTDYVGRSTTAHFMSVINDHNKSLIHRTAPFSRRRNRAATNCDPYPDSGRDRNCTL